MGTGGLGGAPGLGGGRLAGKLGARRRVGEKVVPRQEEIQVPQG